MTQAKSTYFAAEHDPVLRGGKRYLTLRQVAIRYNKSASSIDRLRKDDRVNFPQPLRTVPGGPLLFPADELDQFDAARLEQTAQEQPGLSEQARSRKGSLAEHRHGRPRNPGVRAGDDGSNIAAIDDLHLPHRQEPSRSGPPSGEKRAPIRRPTTNRKTAQRSTVSA